jgi:hypothetical protein
MYSDDNNMTFVGTYCLFVAHLVPFAPERNMPSKSHVIPLLMTLQNLNIW